MWGLSWKSTAFAALTAPLWGSALLIALAAGWLLATPAAVLGLVFVVVPGTISQAVIISREIATLGLHTSLRRARDRFAPVIVNYIAYRWVPWPARWLGRFLMRFQGVRNVVESVEAVAYATGTTVWQSLSHVARQTLEAGESTGRPGELYRRMSPPTPERLTARGLPDTGTTVPHPFPPPAHVSHVFALPGQFDPTHAHLTPVSPIPKARVNVDRLYRGYGAPLTPEEARHRQALHAKTLAKALAGRPGFPSVSKSPRRAAAPTSPQATPERFRATAETTAAKLVGEEDEASGAEDYEGENLAKASSMAV